MDNRILNINGRGLDRLVMALRLAAVQEWDTPALFTHYEVDQKYGLILGSHQPSGQNAVRLLAPMTAEQIGPMVLTWLNSEDAKTVEMTGWDADCDHDGSNALGWRVYVEDWGQVGQHYSPICAVKPAWMWFGK